MKTLEPKGSKGSSGRFKADNIYRAAEKNYYKALGAMESTNLTIRTTTSTVTKKISKDLNEK